ncbi:MULTISPECIES: hypothetical protein [unclassified Hyphomonas]|jgi:hypothetical protein|uniref:Adsorption protein n=1 Tax=hydrothermal vent metagenome TaxID=652676 RepID=A0A160U1H2_9ZZZZ|nr:MULTISPECIES: hypothetical protein [unclassified Hyphomonas]MAL47519.1 hypothetical protein [Hyphomonas sp.]|tara:strand:- start:256 stop:1554 length:1299 start_codon:yes stop_codon:yes gene_type:complete
MRLFSVAIGFALLPGCSSINGQSLAGSQINYDPYVSRSFYDSNYSNESLKFVDLLHALDPDNTSGWRGGGACETSGSGDLRADEKLACALNGFYSDEYADIPFELESEDDGQLDNLSLETNTNLMFRRNRLQDRVILASNQACDDYKRHLLATQSETNFVYGNMAVLTGGLGAIFTPPSTSRALSGASAIITGSRAEYNSSFFRKLLAEVITRGISEERDTLFKDIKKKQKVSIRGYSVEQALADAVQYNAKCSLIAGLENAQKAQSFYADPGLERMSELFDGETKGFASIFQTLKALDPSSANDLVQQKLEDVAKEELATATAKALVAASALNANPGQNEAKENLKTALESVRSAKERVERLSGSSPEPTPTGGVHSGDTSDTSDTSEDPRTLEDILLEWSEEELVVKSFTSDDLAVRNDGEEALLEGGNN